MGQHGDGSHAETLDQPSSGDMRALGRQQKSGCASGRRRCVLHADVTTLAHAERRRPRSVDDRVRHQRTRHTERPTRRYHRSFSAQMEQGKTVKPKKKTAPNLAGSAAPSDYLKSVPMAVVSLDRSGNRDNLVIPSMHVTNSRCRGMWLPSGFIIAAAADSRLFEIPSL